MKGWSVSTLIYILQLLNALFGNAHCEGTVGFVLFDEKAAELRTMH